MRKLLIIILSFILLYSCKSKSALDFSEAIVNKEQSLSADIMDTENKVKDFITAGQYDSMAIVSEKMEKLVDAKLTEVRNLKTPDLKYAGDFKSNAIEYFAYMKNVYTTYVKFAKAETDELKEKEYANLQNVVNKKDDVIRKMRDAQKKFAEANGFRLKD
jgi:hypothetical protein